jgi:hypothetical protein
MAGVLMASGLKGRRIGLFRLNPFGYAMVLMFLIILGAFVYYSYPIMYEPLTVIMESLVILAFFLVWAIIFQKYFLPSIIVFYENGFWCLGLKPASRFAKPEKKGGKGEEGDEAERKSLMERLEDGFYLYRDVDYVFLQIDEEEDDGEREEHLRGRFVFHIENRPYRYRAYAVDLEYLDEMLIDIMDDKYIGALVQRVEGD